LGWVSKLLPRRGGGCLNRWRARIRSPPRWGLCVSAVTCGLRVSKPGARKATWDRRQRRERRIESRLCSLGFLLLNPSTRWTGWSGGKGCGSPAKARGKVGVRAWCWRTPGVRSPRSSRRTRRRSRVRGRRMGIARQSGVRVRRPPRRLPRIVRGGRVGVFAAFVTGVLIHGSHERANRTGGSGEIECVDAQVAASMSRTHDGMSHLERRDRLRRAESRVLRPSVASCSRWLSQSRPADHDEPANAGHRRQTPDHGSLSPDVCHPSFAVHHGRARSRQNRAKGSAVTLPDSKCDAPR